MSPPVDFDPKTYRPRHFQWWQEGRVGVIVLNRPERKNPLTFDSYEELRDLFRALSSTDVVRAVVISGAGGNFCSGGDVHEIIGPLTRRSAEGLLEFTRMTGYLTSRTEYLSQLKQIGAAYREVMGTHFPAMTAVEVTALVEPQAKVEIEATAVIL